MENMNTSGSIVELIRKDRRTGAERLVAEYKDRLYGIALGLCGNAAEAEDLVFRTFEQVIDKIDGYREDEAFFAWMHTILLNYYRMSVRSGMAKNTVPTGGLNEMDGLSGVAGPETVIAPLDGNILRKAVEALPQEMREVVVLHYFMDQPVAKIAKMLSIAKGTVKSRLHYARLTLGIRLGVALKRPAVVLIAIGLFLAATAATAAFVALAPSPVAEVDEPVFLDDAPLSFEVNDPDGDDGLCDAVPAVQPAETLGRVRESWMTEPAAEARTGTKVSAARKVMGFRPFFRESQSKTLPSFKSTAIDSMSVLLR